MIKKIGLVILMGFMWLGLSAQSIQQRGTAKVTVLDENLFAGSSFRVPVFNDTASANLVVTLDSCGKLIYTRDSNFVWLRKCSPKRWAAVGSGSGGGGTTYTAGNGINITGTVISVDTFTMLTRALGQKKIDSLGAIKQNNITLTTVGSSGVSTLTGATLNIPDYSLLQTGIGNFYDSVANVLDPIYGGGDGSALRLQGAVASGKSVFIPYGTVMNIHDTTIQLQNYQKLFGGGEIYSATVGTVAYAGMFNMVKTGKYNTIDGITFRGAGKGTFITTDYYTPQNGIQITDSANLITNCIFFGIKGAGVLGMYYTGSFQNLDNNIINNCRFESNTVGVYNFLGGNYQIITGCTMIQNYIGVAQQTANAKIVSTSLNYNHIGIIGEGGPADRGQITGCSMNHNDTALILKNTSYGYLITGTTFFWGDIYLKDADKTTFSNCLIATNANVKVDGSGVVNKNVQFVSCVESNTNTFVEVGTGKIIRAGVMIDNLTRFDISKTLYLRDSVFMPYVYTQSVSSSDSVMLKDAITGQVKLKAQSAFGGGGAISSLTAATGANTINNLNHTQSWNWNSLNAANGLAIGSVSTSLSGDEKLLFSSIGASASGSGSSYSMYTSNQAQSTGTVYGLYSLASNSSFSATGSIAGDFVANASNGSNTAGRFSAYGGSTNYAIIVPASSGLVGIGTSTPDSLLTVELGARFKRGIRASNLPIQYGTKQLRIDGNGIISQVDTLTDFTLSNGSHFLPDSLLIPVSANSLKVRSLQAGSGITLSSNDSSVIITSTGGAGMAIGSQITSATAGSILYAGTNGLLQQSNSYFFYDSANRRFYVGLNSGTGTLNLRAASGNTDFKLTDGSGTETWGAAATTAGDFAFFHSGATPFKIERFATDNAFYINSSGKVGFNTATIDSQVVINGGLRINNGAAQNGYVWTSTGTDGRGTWQAATGGGLSSSNFVFNEVPSGTINGVNTTFTLANTPTAGTVAIFLRGLRMKLTTDYTISGSTITMINIPDTGDDLVADYLK